MEVLQKSRGIFIGTTWFKFVQLLLDYSLEPSHAYGFFIENMLLALKILQIL